MSTRFETCQAGSNRYNLFPMPYTFVNKILYLNTHKRDKLMLMLINIRRLVDERYDSSKYFHKMKSKGQYKSF